MEEKISQLEEKVKLLLRAVVYPHSFVESVDAFDILVKHNIPLPSQFLEKIIFHGTIPVLERYFEYVGQVNDHKHLLSSMFENDLFDDAALADGMEKVKLLLLNGVSVNYWHIRTCIARNKLDLGLLLLEKYHDELNPDMISEFINHVANRDDWNEKVKWLLSDQWECTSGDIDLLEDSDIDPERRAVINHYITEYNKK